MSKIYIELLNHVLEECNYITTVITPDVDKDDFLTDSTLKRAVVRSLEIIGEATKKIPSDVKLRWKDINWRDIAGMRDRLIHDYMGVNYNIVWDAVKNKIPELKKQISNIISQEKEK